MESELKIAEFVRFLAKRNVITLTTEHTDEHIVWQWNQYMESKKVEQDGK